MSHFLDFDLALKGLSDLPLPLYQQGFVYDHRRMLNEDNVWRLENPPPVLSKADFVERYQKGEFGNHSPTWDSLKEFDAIAVNENLTPRLRYAYVQIVERQFKRMQLYHLRNRIAGGETFYNQTAMNAYSMWRNMPNPKDWYVSAMAPTEHTLIQGELMETPYGLYLNYSQIRKPMRDALAEQSAHANGITTYLLLRRYMNPVSFDWTMELLKRYPEHVIEFSVYDKEWGTLPGYNTVFWEVRKY